MRLNFLHKDKKAAIIPLAVELSGKMKYKGRSYRRSFITLSEKLKEYAEHRSVVLYTDSFSDSVMADFVSFVRDKYKLRSTSAATIVTRIHQLFNYAAEQGFEVDFGYKEVRIKKEEPVTVSLTESEVTAIYNLRLTGEPDKVRDLFVIGCYTALRHSDLVKLTPENICNNNIFIKTKKTGVFVEIPIHPIVQEILNKREGNFPATKSIQNYNQMLKRLCRKAGINTLVHVERTVGLHVERKNFKKYELISSHTARRTAATNMYLSGIPTFRIMLITGHKTESSFFRYIRIDKSENARILSECLFFKK